MKNVWLLSLILLMISACAPASTPEAILTPPETEPAIPETTEPTTTSDVPACSGGKMVYHPPSAQVLLIGCVERSVRTTIPNVIWGWDGTQWQVVTEGGPSMQVLGGVAYDTKRNKLVLYGGQTLDTGECVRETWEWDGVSWAQISTNSPTACNRFEMVYDDGQERVLLFGGQDDERKPISETWAWNGETWEQLAADGPEGRAHFGFVHDPTHEQTLLYGGYFGPIFDDFWTLRENAWQKVELSNSPGTLSHFGMAYDLDTNALIIFGGAQSTSTFGSLSDSTWTLTNGSWRETTPTLSPSPRGSPAMTYDPERKRIVLYGGFGTDRNDKNDTWEWDGAQWVCKVNCP
jgi:hypothetical protein